PEDMEAVARGDEPDQPSVLDSASGVDLAADSGVDASAVGLGCDGHWNSEASLGSGAVLGPGVHMPTAERPAAERDIVCVEAAQPATAALPPAREAAAVAPEQYLASGDFGKAVESFGAQETQDPAVLVKRGQARWLQYLQEKKQANTPLKKDDEAVAQAVKD